jgi:hypothetical protein
VEAPALSADGDAAHRALPARQFTFRVMRNPLLALPMKSLSSPWNPGHPAFDINTSRL